jgi:hypothetical protein
MGGGSWSSKDWASYSSSTVGKSVDTIFTTKGASKDYLDPKGVAVRESRDSVDNPNSTAVIVGLDVTGSMGMIANTLAREGLGVLFSEILARKPVTDPHLMFMAIGDAYCDSAPLQVSQFEADNRIIEQLTDIFLEGCGGGNNFESYDLPWYFAAQHTSIDCFEKRGKKGYIFTVGDENAPPGLTAAQIKKFIGDDVSQTITSKELYEMASRMYHIFHVIVEEGQHCRTQSAKDAVIKSWGDLIGSQHVLMLADHKSLSEVIVSAIQVVEGADVATVTSSWSGSTAVAVAHAIKGLSSSTDVAATKGGVVRFGKKKAKVEVGVDTSKKSY